jgi:hypothetical protein
MSFLLHVKSLLALVVIATAALGLGSLVAGILGRPFGDRRRALIGETTLGLVAAGAVLMFLGLADLLYRPAIFGFTFACAVAGILRLRRTPNRAPESGHDLRGTDPHLASVTVGHVAASVAVLAAVASLLTALAPPTAGDALCYHLELPKRCLEQHALAYSPHDDNCTYPLLAEMWFAWALALDGPVAAQLTQWLCGLLLAGWTWQLAQPFVGTRGASAAAAVVLVVPGVNNQMTVALNDVALALPATAALVTWLEARRTASLRSYVVVGIFIGGAIGVKYTALVFAAVLGGAWLSAMAADRSHRRSLALGAVVAAAAAVLIGGPWYLRAAVLRGDPVYPFLTKSDRASGPSTFPEAKTPLGRGVGALLAAPWSLTMEPERVGGRAHQFGPLFLMFLPCAIPLLRNREFRIAAVVAGGYGAACLLMRQNIRFLLPCLPVAAVGVAYAWHWLAAWPGGSRRVAAMAAVGMLLFLGAIPLARLRHVPKVAFGLESQEEYLARVEPSFPPAVWMNRHLPPDAHVLSQEQRAYYIGPAVTRENIYRRNTAYPADISEKLSLNERMRFAGFTHLLLTEGIADDESAEESAARSADAARPDEASNIPQYDGTLSELVDRAIAVSPETAPKPLAEWRTADAAGAGRRYRLLELGRGCTQPPAK